MSKLAPILPSKIRLSFLRRQSAVRTEPSPRNDSVRTPTFSQFSEMTIRRNNPQVQHNTFPRSHSHSQQLTYAPRIYLHTPQRELERNNSTNENWNRRSLPTTRGAVSLTMDMPVCIDSSPPTSARASLRTIATDSLALESQLESVLCRD
jgi:hypothetical protein